MNANQKISEIIKEQREDLLTLTDRSVLRQLFDELERIGPSGTKCIDCGQRWSHDTLVNPNTPSADRARLKSLVGKIFAMVEGTP